MLFCTDGLENSRVVLLRPVNLFCNGCCLFLLDLSTLFITSRLGCSFLSLVYVFTCRSKSFVDCRCLSFYASRFHLTADFPFSISFLRSFPMVVMLCVSS